MQTGRTRMPTPAAPRKCNPMKSPLIAVAIPQSGPHAAFGEQIRTGVLAALPVVNALQPPDSRFEANFFDDACEVKRAVNIARQIVPERPVAVIGHVCSDTSMAASAIYGQAGIPMITPASSSEALTAQGHAHLFRVAAREGEQAAVIAAYIGERYPHALVGMVREDDYSGIGHAARVAAALTSRGVRVGAPLVADYARLDTISDALRQTAPEIVFYGGHDAALLGKLIVSLRKAGYRGQIISNDGAQQMELWHSSLGLAEGVIFAFEQDYRNRSDASEAVRRIAETGSSAEGFALNAYACVEIVHQAFIAASDSRPCHPGGGAGNIADSLHRHTFATCRGAIRFDSRGEMLNTPGALFVWHAGRISAWTP